MEQARTETSDEERREHVRVGDSRMPVLGLGTWQVEGRECVESVADAILAGYRHIDTAEAYGNEREVGQGIRRSGVQRDEVWVTTKVWWKHLSRDECIGSAEASLERLGVDSIDLLHIHWPPSDVSLEEPLEAFMELEERGVVRHLGVSNFTPEMLGRAAEVAPIDCVQVEYHPWLSQDALLDAARAESMAVTAYSPLGRGRALEDDTLRDIGKRYDKSPAQVALRWLVQQPGVSAIPRASEPEHRRENLRVFDFELEAAEMERIAALDEGYRIIDPDFAPEWEG